MKLLCVLIEVVFVSFPLLPTGLTFSPVLLFSVLRCPRGNLGFCLLLPAHRFNFFSLNPIFAFFLGPFLSLPLSYFLPGLGPLSEFIRFRFSAWVISPSRVVAATEKMSSSPKMPCAPPFIQRNYLWPFFRRPALRQCIVP